MGIDLKDLGITQEELTNRVIETAAHSLFRYTCVNEDGDPTDVPSDFRKAMQKYVTEAIDVRIKKIADDHVLPKIAEYFDGLILKETNEWGEPKGKPITPTEYFVKAVQNYLTEQVNWSGKSRTEDSYSWTAAQTRLAHMVHGHIHYHVEQAVKAAFGGGTKALQEAIEATARIKCKDFAESIKVAVQTAK